MVTAGEYRIARIVAVWRDEASSGGARKGSRRLPVARFLRRSSALLTAGLVVAACSGAAEEPTTTKNEGVFVHALESEPESLDPARAPAGGYGDRAIIQVYEFLVDIGPTARSRCRCWPPRSRPARTAACRPTG